MEYIVFYVTGAGYFARFVQREQKSTRLICDLRRGLEVVYFVFEYFNFLLEGIYSCLDSDLGRFGQIKKPVWSRLGAAGDYECRSAEVVIISAAAQ